VLVASGFYTVCGRVGGRGMRCWLVSGNGNETTLTIPAAARDIFPLWASQVGPGGKCTL
jgi:hypothetical protein